MITVFIRGCVLIYVLLFQMRISILISYARLLEGFLSLQKDFKLFLRCVLDFVNGENII